MKDASCLARPGQVDCRQECSDLHTYTNTVKILCDACRVEFESSAFKCERRLIEQAFSLNHAGKSLTIILDDAHLMDLANLRPGQFPDRGPPRSGLGDFHHPAPPWVRLTASHPRSAP